ncbi:hypothetical protein GWK47_011477 [Chionoecetes opilio]|uniref:Uncharacterized protein n=1 Tax=Chionoecetes opilio TaxID=41210 RepID=A0A8J5CPU8_CHIOP|nr:hypothetical protein GWK47_011477 [Chionoecetes opilio]
MLWTFIKWRKRLHGTGVPALAGMRTNDGWAERKDWEPLALRQYFKMRRAPSPAKGTSSFTPVTRNPAAGHTCGPEGVQSSRTFMRAPGQGLKGVLRRARESVPLAPGLTRRWSKEAPMCGMRYARPLQPRRNPLPTPPPQYPFQQVVLIYFNWTATPISPSLTGSRGGSKWSKPVGDATSARLITVFPTMVQALRHPKGLSCDGGTTSPARNPGASSTPGVCG